MRSNQGIKDVLDDVSVGGFEVEEVGTIEKTFPFMESAACLLTN